MDILVQRFIIIIVGNEMKKKLRKHRCSVSVRKGRRGLLSKKKKKTTNYVELVQKKKKSNAIFNEKVYQNFFQSRLLNLYRYSSFQVVYLNRNLSKK